MFDEYSSAPTEWCAPLQAQFRETGARMTGSLMSRTNPAAGLADARQPFRNKETIMFNRLALALLAATLISAPVRRRRRRRLQALPPRPIPPSRLSTSTRPVRAKPRT